VEPEEPAASTAASTSETPEPEPPSRADVEINVGIGPQRGGLNPHLIADDSSFVRSLASLVLPSAFRDGAMDADVLDSAEVIEPAEGMAQTVRYVISPAAQWSDGTPITGADFRYLWRGMTRTPGVVEPAGYLAIDDVRVSGDGRTVTVDFADQVADWPSLFTHLLPSHHLQSDASDFAAALVDDIPASAGRYMIRSVDPARGVISVNRNDRFWGANPAETDLVTFREIRTVTQGVDQLRSGQISFLDIVPSETSVDAYSLMQDTQVRTLDLPRELRLTLSTASPTLSEHSLRAELHSLIDVPLIARLAAGRSADLNIPEHTPPRDPAGPPPAALQAATAERPLRLGVDPADATAIAAGRTIIDVLARYDVEAEVVSSDLDEITGQLLPEGEVDAVITWEHVEGDSADLASDWLCPDPAAELSSGNLSGYCTPESDALARQILAGEVDTTSGAQRLRATNEREHLSIPLLGERRVLVLGEGIVGPDPDLDNWTAGISTVPSWRKL